MTTTAEAFKPRTRVSVPILALVEATRPAQWIKNLACLAGLIFSGRLFWPEMELRAWFAVGLFSACASAVYLLNDYLDRHKDRTNPRTAHRPIASNRLPIPLAMAAFFALATGAMVGAAVLSRTCLGVLFSYLLLNIAYSIRLKNTVIADVICIAIGFVLRVLFGVYAVQVAPTPWIILCMFFLALFLGFGKRRGELENLGERELGSRPVLAEYTVSFLDLAIGITATLTVMSYSLYCIAPHHGPAMVVTVLPVMYCVLRYAYKMLVEGHGQSPERLLYTDRMLWVGIASWVVLSVAVIYGPAL